MDYNTIAIQFYIKKFRLSDIVCPNRMIGIVGQSHIHQDSKSIVVDACPPHSSICLVKFYPSSMCVFRWACTCPNSMIFIDGRHPHPDSTVVINGWHPSRFYGGCRCPRSTEQYKAAPVVFLGQYPSSCFVCSAGPAPIQIKKIVVVVLGQYPPSS